MRKLTWTTEEKQEYVAKQLKRYSTKLEEICAHKFFGNYQTQLDCNSKYLLDVGFTVTDSRGYTSYELGLTLYKKENNVAQHSLRLAFDKPKMFRGGIYWGSSTPCYRGKLRVDKSIRFERDYVEPNELRRAVVDGIHKDELLFAYFDVMPKLTDFVNSVYIKAEYSHLKVEGLEDD